MMILFKLKPVAETDFAALARPSSPNTYLLCPQGFSTSEPDQIAPVFSHPAEAVMSAWKSMAHQQPQTSEHPSSSQNAFQVTHVQRTPLLGYPDVITTEIIPLTDSQSTIAVYSRSQYGHSDLGANKKRVTLWLSNLSDHLG